MNFQKLEAFLNTLPQKGLPACSLIVTHKGKEVYSLRVRGKSFKTYFVEYLEPFDEVRVYAKETDEESAE